MSAAEITSHWQKSSFSNSSCVEVAAGGEGRVAVRDSKHTEAGVLLYSAEEFRAFLRGVKAGEFDHFVDG